MAPSDPGGVVVAPSPLEPPPVVCVEQSLRVIVFASSVTAFERRVRIRPSTVALLPSVLAPSAIVVPLNALAAPSETPVASLDSCQKMLHALGAVPPLTIFTEPAAAAAVVRSVPWKMKTAFGSPSKSSVRPVLICSDPCAVDS